MKKILILITIISGIFFGQNLQELYKDYGKIIKYESNYAPFPHKLRMEGHKYNNKVFPYSEHYADSTILVFVPKNFIDKKSTDFTIYFHGWYNNVDTTLVQFELIQQFVKSRKNGILIVVQGPKNAPDSFGGKLEEKGIFENMMKEIVSHLVKDGILKSTKIGNISLSGHSGAYRVISFILNRGGLLKNISSVFLFDALYGQLEKYTNWIKSSNGKFIAIYTNDGGTKDMTELLMDDLVDWNIGFKFVEEKNLTDQILKNNRIVIIHSEMGHNDIISKMENFYKFNLNSK